MDKKFSRLLVIETADNDKYNKSQWLCQCDCGNKIIIAGASLLRGLSKSCGCYKHEVLSKGHGQISGAYWRKTFKQARKRNIVFDVSLLDVWRVYEKQKGLCALSGIKLKFVSNYDKYYDQTASLDRINAVYGYVMGNIRWIHKTINKMKSNIDDKEFIMWCNKVINPSLNINILKESLSSRNCNWKGFKEISGRYWNGIIKCAEERNIKCNLSIQDAWYLFVKQQGKCAITGVTINFVLNHTKYGKQQTASLDRINNNKGYCAGNIQWVHKTINRLKWTLSEKEFKNWCKLICEYNV